MEMLASYYALTDQQMTKAKEVLSSLNDDSVIDFVEFVSEFDDSKYYADLDELWSGLHFLLKRFGRADYQVNNKTSAQIGLY